MLFLGKQEISFNYSAYGYTRGNGKIFHGGDDIRGLSDKTILFPDYKGKKISGKVIMSTIVANKADRTWEWGNFVCVQLDANQTPDAVNYLYFCHNRKNLVKVGEKVSTGTPIAIMGNTGNAAQASPPIEHVHFEVRASRSGKGLSPSAYTGIPSKKGVYGTEPEVKPKLWIANIGPVSKGDLDKVQQLAAVLQVPCEIQEV